MITINREVYKELEKEVKFKSYQVVQNGKKRKGKAPFISFHFYNKNMYIEMNYDEKWLQEMKLNIKENITPYITDIGYEDEKGWLSLTNGEYSCYLERINNYDYNLELKCETEFGSESFKISINENINLKKM